MVGFGGGYKNLLVFNPSFFFLGLVGKFYLVWSLGFGSRERKGRKSWHAHDLEVLSLLYCSFVGIFHCIIARGFRISCFFPWGFFLGDDR